MKMLRVTCFLMATAVFAAAAGADGWETVDIGGDPGDQPRILDMTIDVNVVWLSSKNEGLYAYDGVEWVHHVMADEGLRWNDYGYVMFADAAREKWVTRDRVGPDPWSFSYTADRLDDALTLTDKTDDVWTYYSWDDAEPAEFINPRVFSIAEDSEGNKWFGYRDEDHLSIGVVSYLIENDPTTTDDDWRHYDNALEPYLTQFYDDDVRALAIDHDERLWIGYHERGVDVWDYGDIDDWEDDVWTHYDVTNGLPSNLVHTIYVAQDGRVWVGTLNGLAFYNPRNDSWTTIPGDELPGIQARTIDEDLLNYLWIGTEDGVRLLYPNGTAVALKDVPSAAGLAGKRIDAVGVDGLDGHVWALALEEVTQTTTLHRLASGYVPWSKETFYVYPNPWRSDTYDPIVNVRGVPDGTKIEIFDIAGERVRALATREQPYGWDLLDASSNKVPSGVYIVRAEPPQGDAIVTKVAVIW